MGTRKSKKYLVIAYEGVVFDACRHGSGQIIGRKRRDRVEELGLDGLFHVVCYLVGGGVDDGISHERIMLLEGGDLPRNLLYRKLKQLPRGDRSNVSTEGGRRGGGGVSH